METHKINEIVTKKLRGKLSRVNQVHMPDPEYYAPTKQEVINILKETKVDRRIYKTKKYDCDDFAFTLKQKFINKAYDESGRRRPYAFGMIWGKLKVGDDWGAHAINWFIENKNRLWLVEPQTDEIFKPSDSEIQEAWFLYM